tara:strand:- start:34 stop:330 length:297 start_codon:yes stop_codon:yes gene_type:complete
MTDATYLPLPSSVTIKQSDIHGLGLWAVEEIKEGTEIGMSHFYWGESIQRTPLGAFYNHSDDPNIYKTQRDSRFFMTAIKDILPGEEITCTYTFYKCD